MNKNMKGHTFFITLLIAIPLITQMIPQTSFAKSKKHKSQNPAPTNTTQTIMQKFLKNMTAVQEFSISDQEFSKKENEPKIKEYLAELSKLSQDAIHEKSLQSPGFKMSREVLEDHIKDTEKVFNTGNKSFARWKLNATYSLCLSCHTQLPITSQRKFPLFKSKTLARDIDQANFFFITRQFDEALKVYDKILTDYPKNELKADEVELSLERKLAIFSRIKRESKTATQSLQASLQNEKLPEFLKKKAQSWIKIFEELSKDDNISLLNTPAPKAREYVEKLMAKAQDASVDEKIVYYLRISSLAYEYLSLNDKGDLVADCLYWLGVSSRHYDQNLFYSLDEVYLKECMLKFTKNPIAKKCLNEYTEQVTESYSGSGGTNIPEDVKKDLEELKKKVTGE